MRLAEVLKCAYDRLMELAGYVKNKSPEKSGKITFLEAALRNEDLSDDEQKAVIVLLALLHLGVKNIHLGPTLPAFLSPNVANVLVENFGIGGITEVEKDLEVFMGADV